MLGYVKNIGLHTVRALGVFNLMASSSWRQQRLLILCYHGLSTRDEHKWNGLYVAPEFFQKRMEMLARLRYVVLPLAEALERLHAGTLPARSVAITFDDGFRDFYDFAYPILRKAGFPAMLYQTTYYCDYPYPIYNLMLSYLFWRGAGKRFDCRPYGVDQVVDLKGDGSSDSLVAPLMAAASRQDLNPAQRNEVAARIANELGIDFEELMRLRMFQLMTPEQVAEISTGGIAVELHTHRHRTPVDEELFVREIRDNRAWLGNQVRSEPKHFCYPSGVHRSEFLPWLRQEGVISATTCDYGLVTKDTEPLLLPRLLDSMWVTDVDFEGWLSGFSSYLPHRGA